MTIIQRDGMDRTIFIIHFTGKLADDHLLDFYDAAHALVGFQRSLALTAHLVATGEIITQAPALKEANIYSLPPEEGGWKTKAAVVFGTVVGGMSVAPHDSVAGNIATSLYDFVLSESMGVHADYNKTIGQLIEEKKKSVPGVAKLTPGKMDSLVEKCEAAITEMHRPIVKSETASTARIISRHNGEEISVGPELTPATYDYIHFTTRSENPFQETGRVSGYDSNTYKGRIYLPRGGRPVPFALGETARKARDVKIVTDNLAENAQGRYAEMRFIAFHDLSRTGRLKRLLIIEILYD
jgi:hypothetical protein